MFVCYFAITHKRRGIAEFIIQRSYTHIPRARAQDKSGEVLLAAICSTIFTADNLAKLWDHLRNVYASTDSADRGQALIEKVKQLFDDFEEFLPLVRSKKMLPRRKMRVCSSCARNYLSTSTCSARTAVSRSRRG